MLAGSIANAKLTNSSVTVGSTAISLGSAATTVAGLTLTSPTLTTPVLGTPASGTLTNCTSLPVGGITATGTPSSTTYLRGDSTWATISATTNAITNGTSNVTVNSSGGTITAATAGTTAVTIDTSQNVGIGTASPTNKLHVSSSTFETIKLQGTSTVSGINFVNSASSNGYIYYDNGPNMLFYTNGSERMRIDSSGNLGVGVTPSAWNSIWKAIQIGNRTALAQTSSDTLLTNNAYYDSTSNWRYLLTQYASGIAINANNGQVKIITAPSGTAGNAITFTDGPYVANLGTSWTNSSDERLKNITGEIQNGLAKVCTLRAAEYTWKTGNNTKQQVGLIAQDVLAVLPEVVVVPEKEFDGTSETAMGVNYDQVIPLLVASIKELKAINDTQAETINALTARIVALEAK
jgi:hypothetical protein